MFSTDDEARDDPIAALATPMQPFALTLDVFLDHAAKWHPAAEIVTGGPDCSVTRAGYAAVRARANRLSGAFARLRLGRGDVLATLAWNTQSHFECWFGAMGAGIVCHTLNPRLTAEQLAAMLRQSRARVLAVGAGLAPLAEALVGALPSIEHLILLDEPSPGANAVGDAAISEYETLVETLGEPVAWGGFPETAPAGLCFTSGTTGPPKGVLYTHRSNYLLTMRVLQADAVAITDRDVLLAVVPMFHANGWGLPFAAPAVGAKLVLPGRDTDGASLAALIAREGVTVAAGVPTVWSGLLEHLETAGGDLPSLERVLVGGAAIPQSLLERLEARLGVIVQTSWGMTELSPLGTISSPRATDRQGTVAGRVSAGSDLLLVDGDGVPLAHQRGAEGRLMVRGASAVQRYLGAADDAVDAHGWFDTGDLAILDDAGNLTITGRTKDLIKSGGEWINPAEIEAIVGALAGIAFAAVIGRSDARWGERPVLVIEADGSAPDNAAIRAELAAQVARWWLPDAVVRVDRMPLAATGKIDKAALRARYGEPEEEEVA